MEGKGPAFRYQWDKKEIALLPHVFTSRCHQQWGCMRRQHEHIAKELLEVIDKHLVVCFHLG